jgi:2-iminobutanoate/2-iminopropanoate deaminase
LPKTTLSTDRLMRPIAEFSMAHRVGDLVIVGATAGTDAQRELQGYRPGRIDAAEQTTAMLRNMETALHLLGARVDDIVRFKAYLDDWRDGDACEEAVAGFLPPRTARMTVGSWGFPLPQAVVEAELMAVVGGGDGGLFHGTAMSSGATPRDGHAHAARALADLREALGDAGLSPRDAVMLTVTLADLRCLPAFEEAFRRVFSPPYPARTVIAAPLSGAEALVAIECVATKGGGTPIGESGEAAWLGAASPAMLAGDILYVSGQLGREGFDGDVEAETEAAWRRIATLVEAAGMGLEDVVATTNVLTDWRHYRGFNKGFGRFVSAPYPPRTTISVGLVERGARVQIEAMAHRRGRDAHVIEVTGEGN